MPTVSPIEHTDTESRCPGAERILHAARTLFAQRGLNGVSIQQIADAAEVSKANVFHHYSNKQALYRAVLNQSADEFRELLADLAVQTSAQGLEVFAHQHLTRLLEDPATTWLFLRALSDPHSGAQRRLAEEVVSEAMGAVIEAFVRLREAGVLPTHTDAGTLTLTLLGSHVIYFQLRNILPQLGNNPDLQDPDTFTRNVTRLLTHTVDQHQKVPKS